jgi:hypothetical protein
MEYGNRAPAFQDRSIGEIEKAAASRRTPKKSHYSAAEPLMRMPKKDR